VLHLITIWKRGKNLTDNLIRFPSRGQNGRALIFFPRRRCVRATLLARTSRCRCQNWFRPFKVTRSNIRAILPRSRAVRWMQFPCAYQNIDLKNAQSFLASRRFSHPVRVTCKRSHPRIGVFFWSAGILRRAPDFRLRVSDPSLSRFLNLFSCRSRFR